MTALGQSATLSRMQQHHGHLPHAPAPVQYAQAPAQPTVWGVPLEYGERVLYYKRHTGIGERIFIIFIGIIFLPILIGILFLYMGIRYEATHNRVQVITDRRMLGISGTRKLRTVIPLAQIGHIKYVTPGNKWVIHGAGEVMIFYYGEHNHEYLSGVIRSLGAPQQLPAVAFEP